MEWTAPLAIQGNGRRTTESTQTIGRRPHSSRGVTHHAERFVGGRIDSEFDAARLNNAHAVAERLREPTCDRTRRCHPGVRRTR
jgi:hypothetical protein